MKHLLATFLVVALVFVFAGEIMAETKIDFEGQIRVRDELNGKSFDSSDAVKNYVDMRTRFGVRATVKDNVEAFVQLQDSRRFGQFDGDGNRLSGTLTNGANVDVHQAFFHVKRMITDGLSFKAGRFEFAKGNQRVFGSVGWSNVGRSWDGAELTYTSEDQFKASLFGLKAAERNNSYYNADFDIFGLYTTINDFNLDIFGVYEYDADTTGLYTGINRLDRMSFGMYYHRKMDAIDFEMNGVYQTGKQARGLYDALDPALRDNMDKIDIAAFMFQAEAGYNFTDSPLKRVALGVDFASGDDPTDADTYQGYNNLYYTGHKFRGFMDYFIASHESGLIDLYGKVAVKPNDDWTIKLHGHYFQTAEDYTYMTESDTTMVSDVGMEFDLTVVTTVVEGIKIQGGASIFMVEDAWAEVANPENGTYGYLMGVVNF